MTLGDETVELSQADLGDLIRDWARLGIDIWIDGGWGVDALLGHQSRPHGDVDIVIQEKDCPVLLAALAERGFVEVAKPDSRAWNFVMGDAAGREVDFHVVVFDAKGDGIYGPPENGDFYPAQGFTGRGEIDGEMVLCMSVDFQIGNRQNWPLRDKDRADIAVLRRAFGHVDG